MSTKTPEDFREALRLSGVQYLGLNDSQARDAMTMLGLTVEPEKPAPGTWHITVGYMAPEPEVPAYVSEVGNLHLVHPDGRIEGFSEGSDAWPALTPAVVVPKGDVVELTEAEVGEFFNGQRFGNTNHFFTYGEDLRATVAATVLTALARHSHRRALPEREDVRKALDSRYRDPALRTVTEAVESMTDAVVAMYEGGPDA